MKELKYATACKVTTSPIPHATPLAGNQQWGHLADTDIMPNFN